MNTIRVALFGHRDLTDYKIVESRLSGVLRDLMREELFVDLYIGRNGEFDIYAASVIKRTLKALGTENCSLTLVLPYKDKNIEYYEEYYDCVIIPTCVEGVFPKGVITKRNKWLVEMCDLLICYVERDGGGAYTAMKRAEKLGKKIVNIANEVDIE